MAGTIAKLTFSGCLYHVWKEQIQRCFNKKAKTKELIVDAIVAEARVKARSMEKISVCSPLLQHIAKAWDMQKISALAPPRSFVWQKAQEGTWVLSCDGAMSHPWSGYGGLLRDHEGLPLMGFAGTSQIKHVLWLEMHAIWRGLQIAKERKITNLRVNTDSKLAVQIIKNESKCPWCILSVKRKIEVLWCSFPSKHIDHIWREANHPANFLAN